MKLMNSIPAPKLTNINNYKRSIYMQREVIKRRIELQLIFIN